LISLLRHQMIGDTTLHKLSTLSTYSFCIVRTLHNPIKTLWRVQTLHNFFGYVIKCKLYLKRVFFCVPGLGGAWNRTLAIIGNHKPIVIRQPKSVWLNPAEFEALLAIQKREDSLGCNSIPNCGSSGRTHHEHDVEK
jgi:hypothetical protein